MSEIEIFYPKKGRWLKRGEAISESEARVKWFWDNHNKLEALLGTCGGIGTLNIGGSSWAHRATPFSDIDVISVIPNGADKAKELEALERMRQRLKKKKLIPPHIPYELDISYVSYPDELQSERETLTLLR